MAIETMPKLVGASVTRSEDPRFLTGRGRYVDDVRLPGTLHIAFVRSPVAHARIRSISADEAAALDGVVAVFTGRDLEGEVPAMVPDLGTPDYHPAPQQVLAVDTVQGGAVLVVGNGASQALLDVTPALFAATSLRGARGSTASPRGIAPASADQ